MPDSLLSRLSKSDPGFALAGMLRDDVRIADFQAALLGCIDAALARQEEPLAWESTTEGYIKFVTDRQYRCFSEAAKAWYRPICHAPRPDVLAMAQEAKRLVDEFGKAVFEYTRADVQTSFLTYDQHHARLAARAAIDRLASAARAQEAPLEQRV